MSTQEIFTIQKGAPLFAPNAIHRPLSETGSQSFPGTWMKMGAVEHAIKIFPDILKRIREVKVNPFMFSKYFSPSRHKMTSETKGNICVVGIAH